MDVPEREDELVCFCFEVTRSEVLQAIERYSLKTVEEIREKTQACSGCQCCYPDLVELLSHFWSRRAREEDGKE